MSAAKLANQTSYVSFRIRRPPSHLYTIAHAHSTTSTVPLIALSQHNVEAVRQCRAETLERLASEFAVMWESEQQVNETAVP